MILLTCDFPPGTNQAYRIITIKGHGSLTLTPEARDWKAAVTYRLKEIGPPQFLDAPIGKATVRTAKGKHTVPLSLAAVWITSKPIPWTRDLDGPYKFIQDCVADAWDFNDSHIRGYTHLARTVADSGPTRLALHLTYEHLLPSPRALLGRVMLCLDHMQMLALGHPRLPFMEDMT